MIEIENIALRKDDEHTQSTEDVEIEENEEQYYVEDGWSEILNKRPKGWAISIKDDRYYGNCVPFLYLNGEPLIIIGPDCIYTLNQGHSL